MSWRMSGELNPLEDKEEIERWGASNSCDGGTK